MSSGTYVRFLWWIGTKADGSKEPFRFLKGAEHSPLWDVKASQYTHVDGPFPTRKHCIKLLDKESD